MSLYPNHKERGVQKTWEMTSMETITTRRFLEGALPPYFAEATCDDAVAWFEENGDGGLRLLVADFSNGKRVSLRINGNRRTIGIAPRPSVATLARTEDAR